MFFSFLFINTHKNKENKAKNLHPRKRLFNSLEKNVIIIFENKNSELWLTLNNTYHLTESNPSVLLNNIKCTAFKIPFFSIE